MQEDEEDGRSDREPLVEEQPVEVADKVELSLNSVVGLTTPGTMKLKGTVGPRVVILLIDYGATHNFISLQLVQQLGIPTTVTNNYGLSWGQENQ